MDRRDFLKAAALTTAAAAAKPVYAGDGPGSNPQDKPAVKNYREIGKTGLKMSDISFGGGKLSAASMILRAVDYGINYFDTAPDYGVSEETIGEAMGRIKRDKIIITSKFCNHDPYPGHLPAGSKKKDYIAAVENSLSRLKTDYLDFVFVHALGEMSKDAEEEKKRLLSEEMFEAAAVLKRTGKIRFLGTSSHGPGNMETLLTAAVSSGQFDVIMPSFNFMKFPALPEVMKEAHKKGVGVIAMKTLAGAKDMNMEAHGEEFPLAAFKWVLKNPEVSGLIVTMKTVSDMELYLKASGAKFSASDQTILERYACLYNREYCRTGCGECEASCPKGVEIASVLRYRMYFKDYGMERRAMESYASLKAGAAACAECGEPSCAGKCPHDLPIKALLSDSHRLMSFRA